MVVYIQGDTPQQEEQAKLIFMTLWDAYPNHPWDVRVREGLISIYYANPLLLGRWGMHLKTKEVDHDAAVLKRKVISLAGEWLERSGLKRGKGEDKEITYVEGIPDKWQKNTRSERTLRERQVCAQQALGTYSGESGGRSTSDGKRPRETDVDGENLPLRTEPRPQVGD